MNPAMLSTVSLMVAQQLQQIVPTIRLREADIYQYIVREGAKQLESHSSDSSFESACDTADETSQEANQPVSQVCAWCSK